MSLKIKYLSHEGDRYTIHPTADFPSDFPITLNELTSDGFLFLNEDDCHALVLSRHIFPINARGYNEAIAVVLDAEQAAALIDRPTILPQVRTWCDDLLTCCVEHHQIPDHLPDELFSSAYTPSTSAPKELQSVLAAIIEMLSHKKGYVALLDVGDDAVLPVMEVLPHCLRRQLSIGFPPPDGFKFTDQTLLAVSSKGYHRLERMSGQTFRKCFLFRNGKPDPDCKVSAQSSLAALALTILPPAELEELESHAKSDPSRMIDLLSLCGELAKLLKSGATPPKARLKALTSADAFWVLENIFNPSQAVDALISNLRAASTPKESARAQEPKRLTKAEIQAPRKRSPKKKLNVGKVFSVLALLAILAGEFMGIPALVSQLEQFIFMIRLEGSFMAAMIAFLAGLLSANLIHIIFRKKKE